MGDQGDGLNRADERCPGPEAARPPSPQHVDCPVIPWEAPGRQGSGEVHKLEEISLGEHGEHAKEHDGRGHLYDAQIEKVYFGI